MQDPPLVADGEPLAVDSGEPHHLDKDSHAPFVAPLVWHHFQNPLNVGCLEDPHGEGWAGDLASRRFMRIQVRVVGDHIDQASFGTYGCMPAIACGSFITDWARGREFDEIFRLTPRFLRRALGGLPAARVYCADLAVEALQAATRDAITRKGRDT